MNINEMIYEAIEKENIKEVKRLLNSGVELKPDDYVKWKAEHYDNPLYRACEKGEIGVVKYVIKNGNTISDQDLVNAVYIAVENDNLDIAELLIEGGIKLSGIKLLFYTNRLIDLIAYKKYYNLITILLNESKENKEIVEFYLQSAATKYGDIKIVEMLFETTDEYNSEMLYSSIMSGNMDIAFFLWEKGVIIHEKVESNRCLKMACKKGNINLVRLLLEHGAKPNKTIIKAAQNAGETEIVDILLSNITESFI